MNSKILKYCPFLPLLLLCIFYACKAMDFPVHDFANYYFGGKFLTEGNFDAQLYFPYDFNKAISDLGHQNIFAAYAPNTPFLALFFAPFSLVAVTAAKIIFNCISIGLFVFSIVRLFSFYSINPKFALLVPLLFWLPIKNNLLFGQVYFLLFFLLSESWIAYEKEQLRKMALLLSLAIMLKVFPVLLLVFMLFRKKWNVVFLTLAFCLLLVGVSLAFSGIQVWVFYMTAILPKASNGEIASSFVDNYQSVFMFLKRLFVFQKVENPHPFLGASAWFYVLVFGFKMGVLALGYFVSKKNYSRFPAFSFWIIMMVLLSPYGSTYAFILLLFPVLALFKSDIPDAKKLVACAVLFLVCNVPVSVFIDKAFPFSYLRLFLLAGFVVFFVFWMFRKSIVFKAAAIGCAAMLLSNFSKQGARAKGENIPIPGNPVLVYDYRFENQRLVYFYWNENGVNQASIPFESARQERLDIRENQVLVNDRMVTNDDGNKQKPILIDNKTLFYLSDYDRGNGFYTLRKVELHRNGNR
ncbi:MAG: glycosyltransferase family 87 protein [Flavobacterium sp.]